MRTVLLVALLTSTIGLAYPVAGAAQDPAATSAAAQAEARLVRLAGDSRLAHPAAILGSFRSGAATAAIIVTLKPTPAARYLAEISRPALRRPLEAENAGAPVFYDLEDLDIRTALHDTVTATVARAVDALNIPGVTVTQTFSYQFGFAAKVTAEALEAILERPDVLRVEEDIPVYPSLRQGIPVMNATVPRTTYTGRGIAIAIVDSGVDTRHPKLGGSQSVFNSKVIGGRDVWDNDNDPRPGRTEPGGEHGTAVAGIAAGDLGDEGDYIGGVAPDAKLYAIKISNKRTGDMSLSTGIKGWEWVIKHQYDNPAYPILIMNNSWGSNNGYGRDCDGNSQGMAQVAANALAAGITVFASSGNEGRCGSIGLPACLASVNSVGAVYDANIGPQLGWCVSRDSCATNKQPAYSCPLGWAASDYSTAAKKVTVYSNSASFMTLFAPSHNAYTTTILDPYDMRATDYTPDFGGTSAASPYAAGAAAVLQEAAKAKLGRYLKPEEVRQYLTTTGEPITDTKVAVTKPLINLQAAVTALPGVNRPALSVYVQGDGSGAVASAPAGIDCGSTCTARYDAGTAVTLTAKPAAGSSFVTWIGAGCSTAATCTVTMSQDQQVWATFTKAPLPTPSLTVYPQGSGSGSVASVPAGIDCGATCSARYATGSSVTLTATPAAGSSFVTWIGAGCSTAPTCTVTMSQDQQVWATFAKTPATTRSLTVYPQGSGSGSVASVPAGIDCGSTCTARYANGTSVTLTATPAAGSSFVTWIGAGCSTAATCTVTMSQDQQVWATFARVGPAAAPVVPAASGDGQ